MAEILITADIGTLASLQITTSSQLIFYPRGCFAILLRRSIRIPIGHLEFFESQQEIYVYLHVELFPEKQQVHVKAKKPAMLYSVLQ